VFREILRASAALDRKCSQPGRQAAFLGEAGPRAAQPGRIPGAAELGSPSARMSTPRRAGGAGYTFAPCYGLNASPKHRSQGWVRHPGLQFRRNRSMGQAGRTIRQRREPFCDFQLPRRRAKSKPATVLAASKTDASCSGRSAARCSPANRIGSRAGNHGSLDARTAPANASYECRWISAALAATGRKTGERTLSRCLSCRGNYAACRRPGF
jgi:hypothetical protein